jgi:hypothetical protein
MPTARIRVSGRFKVQDWGDGHPLLLSEGPACAEDTEPSKASAQALLQKR